MTGRRRHSGAFGIPMLYGALLLRRSVRPLVAGAFLVGIAIGIATLSMILLVQSATGSFAVAGGATAAFGGTGGMLAPFRSRAVDRAGQPKVLIPLTILYALALLSIVVLAAADAAAGFYIAAAGLAGAVVPPVGAALRSCWRDVVLDDDELETAYALDNVVQDVYLSLAPLAAGALVLVGSAAAAMGIAAGLAIAGTALFTGSRVSRRWQHTDRRAAQGLAGPMGQSGMRVLAFSVFGLGTAFGAIEIGVASFAVDHGSAAAAGVLLGLLALGSIGGGLWYGSRRWPGSASGRYAKLAGTFALLLAVVSLAQTPLQLGLGLLLAGLLIAPAWTCLYRLLDSIAPPGTATEAYSWLSMANNIGIAAGAGLGGLLIGFGGSELALLLAAAAAAIGALVAVAWRSRLLGPTREAEGDPAAVVAVPHG